MTDTTTSNSNQYEQIISMLAQLMVNCEQLFNEAGTVEQAEEIMNHLEEHDENFHRYEFVKLLRKRLQESMGGLVDVEIERDLQTSSAGMGRDGNRMDAIVQKLLDSKEYHEFSHKLKVEMDQAIENYDVKFSLRQSSQARARGQITMQSTSYEESTLSGSYNQTGFLFMNQDQIAILVERMDKQYPIETRKDAIENLLHLPIVDLQSMSVSSAMSTYQQQQPPPPPPPPAAMGSDDSEYSPGSRSSVPGMDLWTTFKRNLLQALSDQNNVISDLGLYVTARGLVPSSPNSRDMYTTLLEHLDGVLRQRRNNIPKIRDGIDLHRDDLRRIMQLFRIMNDFQHQIPLYWIRYPERFLDDIVEGTISFLSCKQPVPMEDRRLSPIHFVGFLDPTAGWFTKWMHFNYSRIALIRVLRRHTPFLSDMVKCCLQFLDADIKSLSSTDSMRHNRNVLSYSSSQLECLHFLHCFHIMTQLMCYSKGRQLFPIATKEIKVDIHHIVWLCVKFMARLDRRRPRHKNALDPGYVVLEALKRLINVDSVCSIYFCYKEVMEAILKPFQVLATRISNSSSNNKVSDDEEYVLIQLCEIICCLLATEKGMEYILQTEKRMRHMLAYMSQKALTRQCDLPYGLLMHLLFISRQFYSHPCGLHDMLPYDLHMALAACWHQNVTTDSRNNAPITESLTVYTNDVCMKYSELDSILRDNLLNFGNTARGLLALHQSGLMPQSVAHMYMRYINKMQVSRCEKFGYGFLLSRIATTGVGIQALLACGFVRAYILDLWAAIENGLEDKTVALMRPWSTDPIDKPAHKPFINAMNLLSTFGAVYELISNEILPTQSIYSFRDFPETLPALLNRIVIVDSDAKVHSLFNYLESQFIGLRMLALLVSSLDSFCILQTQFKIIECLLDRQNENLPDEENSGMILDLLTMERNYVLVKCLIIGGPSERQLPQRKLDEKNLHFGTTSAAVNMSNNSSTNTLTVSPAAATTTSSDKFISPFYTWPLILSQDENHENVYWISSSTNSSSSDLNKKYLHCPLISYLQENLSQSTQDSERMMHSLQRAFLDTFSDEDFVNLLNNRDYAYLMEECARCVEHCVKDENRLTCDKSDIEYQRPLPPSTAVGIQLSLAYGKRLNLIKQTKSVKTSLQNILKQLSNLLQAPWASSALTSNKSKFANCQSYPGFDWFVATIFLSFQGDEERSMKTLLRLVELPVSLLLWPGRGFSQCLTVTSEGELSPHGILQIFYHTCHYVEFIMAQEYPQLYSVFRLSGYAPAQICQQWLQQIFWCYLDWPSILQYILLVLIMGSNYQIYFCVALLKHMEPVIKKRLLMEDLCLYLKEEPIENFQLYNYIDLMQHLDSEYSSHIASI